MDFRDQNECETSTLPAVLPATKCCLKHFGFLCLFCFWITPRSAPGMLPPLSSGISPWGLYVPLVAFCRFKVETFCLRILVSNYFMIFDTVVNGFFLISILGYSLLGHRGYRNTANFFFEVKK